MPKLTVFLPDSGEVTFDLKEGTNTLGRVADNDIQIEDSSISSHHAEIQVRGNRVSINDLGSTNGTTINGGDASDTPLKLGDSVFFGSVQAQLQGEATGAQKLPDIADDNAFEAPSFSARPAGFANASPYPKKSSGGMDGASKGVLALAGLAILAAAAAIALAFVGMAPGA